ncbi:MAG: glycosyltransferase [Mediterraneibacter gnavus]
MKKKNILIIFTGSLELGGIENSLLGLLDAIDYEEYNVDLFLYGHYGSLFPLINPKANLLPEIKELAYLRKGVSEKIRNGCYYSAMLRLVDEIKLRFLKKEIDNDRTWSKIVNKFVPNLEKKYDLALSFFLPFDLIEKKVKAKVKVGWVHTDYKSENVKEERLFEEYQKVDYIAAVSEQCRNSFTSIFQQFINRTMVVENILSSKLIKEKALEFDVTLEMDQQSISLLSIGRFCYAKNFDNVPFICKELRKLGLNVKWYLIGFGADEKLILQKIKETNMQEYVIILGKRENPYPYIKTCDFYIQPSRYEGKSVAVREAQVLCKPVIITNYETSSSQLKDGYDGVVVSMDNKECAKGIANVIKDKQLQKILLENMKKSDYTNLAEVKKLYELIE